MDNMKLASVIAFIETFDKKKNYFFEHIYVGQRNKLKSLFIDGLVYAEFINTMVIVFDNQPCCVSTDLVKTNDSSVKQEIEDCVYFIREIYLILKED